MNQIFEIYKLKPKKQMESNALGDQGHQDNELGNDGAQPSQNHGASQQHVQQQQVSTLLF